MTELRHCSRAAYDGPMPAHTIPRYPHLVAAAEALIQGKLQLDDTFRTPTHTFRITRPVGEQVLIFAPYFGGICYGVDYILGEGRPAIIRTAEMAEKHRNQRRNTE